MDRQAMSSIFPLRDKVSLDSQREPRLVDLDEDTADEVFETLASRTTREIFLALHRQPQTASDLSDATETTVQNVQYHLEKLLDADLVEVVDTWYSERGSEMKVYAPKDESLVLFAGRDKQHSLRRLLDRVMGIFSILVPSSALVGLGAHWYGGSEEAEEEAVPVDDLEDVTQEESADEEATDSEDDLGIAADEEEESEPENDTLEDTDGGEQLLDNETLRDEMVVNATDAGDTVAGIDPFLAAGLFFVGGLFVFGALTMWSG